MMIQGIVPGPQVLERNPELFWGLVASMWIGNLILVIINLPLIGLWAKLLRVPYRYALYKLDFELAPLALGFVLGRLFEEKLRQSLIISDGSPLTFL